MSMALSMHGSVACPQPGIRSPHTSESNWTSTSTSMLITKAQRRTLEAFGEGQLPTFIITVLVANHSRVIDFFNFANADADFAITPNELSDALLSILKLELTQGDVDQLFEVVDSNHDGVIELKELTKALKDAIPPEVKDQRQPSPTVRRKPKSRSTFGAQASSKRRTAPAFGFGAATRDCAKKIFVSQQHTALATDAIVRSPGPATYNLPPSVGGKQPSGAKPDPPVWGFAKSPARMQSTKEGSNSPSPAHYKVAATVGRIQPLSHCRSEPLFGFGSADRQQVKKVFISQSHQRTDMYGIASPGPHANYKVNSSIGGRQPLARNASLPSFSFASKARPLLTSKAVSPGPHARGTLPQSIGPQPESMKPRASTPTFGAGTRDLANKLYVSQEHTMLSCHGTQSPNKWYDSTSALGKQVSSKLPSRPRSAFSTASRWGAYEREMARNSTPGPGAYD